MPSAREATTTGTGRGTRVYATPALSRLAREVGAVRPRPPTAGHWSVRVSATTTTGVGGRRRARRAPTFAASTRPSTSATEEGRSDRGLARARGPRLSDPLSATAVGARMTARARSWRVTSWQGVFADGHGLGRASTQMVHVGVHHLVEVVDDHDRGGGRSGRGARTRTRPPPLRPPPLRDWGRRPPDRPHPPTAGHWLPRSSSSTTMGTGGRRRRWYPSMFTTLSRSSTTTTERGRSGRELAHARGPRCSAPPPPPHTSAREVGTRPTTHAWSSPDAADGKRPSRPCRRPPGRRGRGLDLEP